MAIYNDSFMNNVTNPVDIFTGISTAIGSDFLIGNLILLGFFLVFLVAGIRYDFNQVLLIDAILTTIIAVLLNIVGMVSIVAVIAPVILFIIAIVFYIFS